MMNLRRGRAWNAAILSTTCLWAAASWGQNCEQKSDLWPFMAEIGSKNAGVIFEANMELRRDCRDLTANGYAGAGVGLLGINAILLETDTQLGLYDRRDLRLEAGISVLGFVVDSFRYDQLVEFNRNDQLRFPVNLNDKQSIMVGPVSVNVHYGLQAEVGASYQLKVAFMEADLKVDPFVESSVYARAGADVGFASALASGRVKLLDDKLNSEIFLSFDQVDFDRVDLTASAVNHMSALEGHIELHAEAKLGSFDRTHTQDLFRWDGYSRIDQVYDVAETIALR